MSAKIEISSLNCIQLDSFKIDSLTIICYQWKLFAFKNKKQKINKQNNNPH